MAFNIHFIKTNKMRTKILSGYFICLFLLVSLITNATQLSGTYSINPSATATTTNFQDFNSAITFLTGSGTRGDGGPSNSSPFGVSGSVTFLVAAATYAQQVNITTTIAGTSPVNTVSFDGGNGNAATRIITYSGVSTNYPTVNITNNPYIAFRNLTINNTGTTYAFGVLITGSSNCCKISNCSINLPLNANDVSIVVGGILSFFPNSTGNYRVDSLQIDSNTIIGGVKGIYIGSPLSNPSVQNKIRYNQILNFYAYGMDINYQNGMNILYNKLIQSASNVNGNGIWSNSLNNNGPNVTIINGNKISCTGGLAIQVLGSNTASNKGFITNNMFGGGLKSSNYLFALQGSNWCISNNSFNYDIVSSSSSSNCPFYLYTSSNISVMNNIFSVKQSGNAALAVNIPSIYYIDSMDYNVFYRQDTNDHQLIVLGSTYNSGNFKGAGGFNQHSLYINPGFVNDTNLHISQTCLRGISLPYITTDIDGNTRNSPPNIGANEVQTVTNDIGTVAILSPTYPIATGAQNLRIRVINYGSNDVFSFNLSYKLNGNAAVTQSWSGILSTCDTVSLLFSGSQQITVPSGTNTLKIYTSNPNYATDGNILNDTITSSFLTAMGGTYIIGSAPSDYTSFTTAVSDLNFLGVGRAIKFLAKSGTYNESIIVTTPTGASVTNTVSFNSIANNRDSVILTYSGGNVMNLSASYFNFNNITFSQTATTGNAINLSGTPAFDTIYNCKLIAPNTSSTSSNIIYANGVTLNNFVLRKNIIQGGYYNLNILSSTSNYSNNCIIDSNILQNTYYSTSLRYFTNLKFKNNTVSINSNNNSFTIQYANTGYEFTGNQVNVSSGLIATMFLSYYSNGTSGNRLKINNNIFTAASTASINLFAPYYYCGFVDFYNNSMVLGNGFLQIGYNSNDIRCYNNSISSNNATYSFYQNESGNSNIDVKNNVISNSNGGVALYWNNTPSGTLFDYNNLYTTGSNLVSVSSGATFYANLSAWRGAYGLDKNSLSYRPAFTNSANNLAPNISDSACWSMNGRGMPTTFITSDINGNARSSQVLIGATDIGAYEFTPNVNPPFAIASPATPTASTTQYFSFGSDTIAQIVWGTSVPSTITAQLYSGTNAPQVGSNSFYQTNAYWNILAPAGTYSYNLKLNYKKNWLQNIPSESNMVIAQKSTAIPWAIASSTHTIDTINNIMAANSLTHFSYFAGTDATSPLPIKLINFTAQKINTDVNLNWQTASELNNDYFEIERSVDGSQFIAIGKVKGNRTTNNVHGYQFTDEWLSIVHGQQSTVYYRLRQVDFDGNSTLSDVRVINLNQTNTDLNIYPNPATNELHIETLVTEKLTVQLFDITGKQIMENVSFNSSTIINISSLYEGMYFVRIINADGAVVKTQKVAVVR